MNSSIFAQCGICTDWHYKPPKQLLQIIRHNGHFSKSEIATRTSKTKEPTNRNHAISKIQKCKKRATSCTTSTFKCKQTIGHKRTFAQTKGTTRSSKGPEATHRNYGISEIPNMQNAGNQLDHRHLQLPANHRLQGHFRTIQGHHQEQ